MIIRHVAIVLEMKASFLTKRLRFQIPSGFGRVFAKSSLIV